MKFNRSLCKSNSYPKLPLNQLNQSFLHPQTHTHILTRASKRILNEWRPQRRHSTVEKLARDRSRAPRPKAGWTLLLSEQAILGTFTPRTLLHAQITAQNYVQNDPERPAHLATPKETAMVIVNNPKEVNRILTHEKKMHGRKSRLQHPSTLLNETNLRNKCM